MSDRNGVVLCGNKTMEAALALNIPIEVVKTDGTRLINIQREDIDAAKDPRGQGLALADNRVGQLDLDWDPDKLREQLPLHPALKHLWNSSELKAVGAELRPGGTNEKLVDRVNVGL